MIPDHHESASDSNPQSQTPLDHALQAASLAEARLREAIEAMPQGIVFLDEEERYILWNKKYAQIYENSADLLKAGEKFEDTLRMGVARGAYPEAVGQEEAWLTERLTRLRSPANRHEQRLSDGRCVLIEERKLSSGGTIGLRVDITDLKRQEENFRLLFEHNPLPMLAYNVATGCIGHANEAACALLGYDLLALRGMPAKRLFTPDNWPSIEALLTRDQSDSSESWPIVCKDGSQIEAVIITRVQPQSEELGTIVSIFNVTERKRIECQMAHMAHHDELTGLYNRAFFRQTLYEVMDNPQPANAITLTIVDLDHFKPVNDTYGHHIGDMVLVQVAERMRNLLPKSAQLCRIGGDEFGIIARQSSTIQTEILAKAIITLLSEAFIVQGHMIHIGATVGYATSSPECNQATTLMRYADLALYAAKGDRRGTCRAFEPYMDAAAQEKSRLEKDLRAAVRGDQLDVHYQPIVDLRSGRIECYEALIRWNHPERGNIPPDVFVPLAEEIGLIDQIGRFVLTKACQEAKNWPEHVKISVNVSPLQFRQGNLLSTVINALSISGLDALRLELEITEAVLMEKGPRPAAIIRNLRGFGVGISLDDFGTGYSSLSYLLNYPFTKIKIDKSFVMNLQKEDSSRAVIRAIIGLGRNLGLTIAAEGIEGPFERDYLREEGCTQGQGYLFGKALPAECLTPHIHP